MEQKVREIYHLFDENRKKFDAKQADLEDLEELEELEERLRDSDRRGQGKDKI